MTMLAAPLTDDERALAGEIAGADVQTLEQLLSSDLDDVVLEKARQTLAAAVTIRIAGFVASGLRPIGDYLRRRPDCYGPVQERIHRLGYETNSSVCRDADGYLEATRLLIATFNGDPSAHTYLARRGV